MQKLPIKFLILAGFAAVSANSFKTTGFDPRTDPDYCEIEYSEEDTSMDMPDVEFDSYDSS